MSKKVAVYACLLFLVVGLGATIPLFAGGCLPNTTCPTGWGVDPCPCTNPSCDTYSSDGYCFLCIPPPPAP